MKKILVITCLAALVYSCGGNEPKQTEKKYDANELYSEEKKEETKVNPEHEKKGIGKFTNVEVPEKLDLSMAKSGNEIYELKCLGCHKLTDEKLVGPGWKDVTSRRSAEWIMNFSTNTDEMLDKDPAAQAMFEECLIRMPNQSLSDADARSVYEFMRENDGVK